MDREETLNLLHLGLLMEAQGTTKTVTLKDDCPRCVKVKAYLAAAGDKA